MNPPAIGAHGDYLHDPVGRAYASQHLLCWWVEPGLRCAAGWGSPQLEDIEQLAQAMAFEASERCPRHYSVVDLTALGELERTVFARFLEAMNELAAGLRRSVAGSAIVVGPGLQAAAAAGYSRLLGDPFPVSIHSELEAAMATGGREDSADLAAALSGLVREARGEQTMAARVALHLAQHSHDDVATCSRALGVSVRTLQRRLGAEAQSFRGLVEAQRVDSALRLLRDTELKVISIATEVGYASVQSLTEAVRRRTGRSPTEYRELGAPVESVGVPPEAPLSDKT